MNAVEPIACLKAGWNLIKNQYWIFVGMSLVGVLIGSIVPFGILLGPMMCGIYLSLFQRRRGEAVDFGNLFRGFDYFGESIIATLLHFVPIILLMVPFYIIFYIALLLMMRDTRQGSQPDPTTSIVFFGLFGILGLIMVVFVLVISVLFTFAYPLIVERRLSGLEAVKLSVRAARANFVGVLLLLLLNGLVGLVGLLLCYVGLFLALPVAFAAISMAYEQVFGLGQAQVPLGPPPPPSFT
jgi:uncharacterized membrane protein